MQSDADTGDQAGVDHLENAVGTQNPDHGLFRTGPVRGGHRVPVMDCSTRPLAGPIENVSKGVCAWRWRILSIISAFSLRFGLPGGERYYRNTSRTTSTINIVLMGPTERRKCVATFSSQSVCRFQSASKGIGTSSLKTAVHRSDGDPFKAVKS